MDSICFENEILSKSSNACVYQHRCDIIKNIGRAEVRFIDPSTLHANPSTRDLGKLFCTFLRDDIQSAANVLTYTPPHPRDDYSPRRCRRETYQLLYREVST